MNFENSIGIFDSGFGGLTVFKAITEKLPKHNFVYLGDNARSPYGDCSFDAVYKYTLEGVEWLFKQGCPLVILACNTASAKALKNIQQLYLPFQSPNNRVLGVIRPTAEVIGSMSSTKSIGVLGTRGTVKSESYLLEIHKFYPDINVYQQSCPMWVTLIESGLYEGEEVDFFVKKYVHALMQQSQKIDTVLLACTHYPLLIDALKKHISPSIEIVSQGNIVAESLVNYLERHPEIDECLGRSTRQRFYTTGDGRTFSEQASIFLGEKITASQIKL